MDGTTVILAGGEVETLTRSLLDNGVKYILYSYFYITAFNKAEFIARMQEEYPGVLWFLDSGAFTYSVQVHSGKKLPEPRRYVASYFEYIRQTGHRWCRIAEPDLDGIKNADGSWFVEEAEVEEWLERLLEEFPDYNIMPTYHGWRGKAKWEKYCSDPRVKTLALGRGTTDDQRWLVMRARAAGKPVHGFALTRFRTTLRSVPYDSVDSSSVWMGQKYGHIYIFNQNKLFTIPPDRKPERKLHAKYWESIGCDPKKIVADDVAEVRKANVVAWRNIAARWQLMKQRRDLHYGMIPNSMYTPDELAEVEEGLRVRGLGSEGKTELTRRSPLTRVMGDVIPKSRVVPLQRTETRPVVTTEGGNIVVPTVLQPVRPRPLERFSLPPGSGMRRPKERE